MKKNNYIIILLLLNITSLAQSDSSMSFWGQIGSGLNISDFSNSSLGLNLCVSLNYEFENNVIVLSYMSGNEYFSFEYPAEYIKSYQIKYGKSIDFTLRGLIFPFPLLLIVKKDFNYSAFIKIGLSYNEGIKRTTLIKHEFLKNDYDSKFVGGFGLPIDIEIREDITNFLGIGLTVFTNFNKVTNYTGFSFN